MTWSPTPQFFSHDLAMAAFPTASARRKPVVSCSNCRSSSGHRWSRSTRPSVPARCAARWSWPRRQSWFPPTRALTSFTFCCTTAWRRTRLPCSVAETRPQAPPPMLSPRTSLWWMSLWLQHVEWGILTELGVVDSSVPVYTLCHDLQVVSAEDLKEEMMESHDLPVDAFATPSGLTRCQAKVPKPFGVRWDLVGPELEEDIGALRELRSLAPERLRAHRDACHATRAEAMRDPPCARPLWSPVTEQEWLMLTDAAVTHFAAEECKMRDGESKKLKWKGKGKGKSRGKKTDSANAQLSAQAESMSAQAEAEAAQQAALQAAQIIQQQQEQFSLPSTLQLRPFQGDLVDDEDSAEQRRLDAAEQQERASSAVKVSAARRQADPNQPSEEERRARAEHLRRQREALMEKKRREREEELSRHSAWNGGTATRAAERACAGQPALPVDDAGRKLADELRGNQVQESPQANAEDAAMAMRRALTAQLKQTLTQSLH
ncbi:5-formyltetrahydrofolate cyclo-ligase-like protein COG0212 (Protein CLUSTERS OF ORTHOLOGOUS GROUP 212) [Durusdinium trenchii]|uniref:5-formyltetrahydrofolate cyclo-ligase-like protein COG0212 (Protein CLUSTERS OF ORTHOLOGOUS GROUP 212) n=1 Tax=Durusdinium trenchii TaxID=1381693 RepID=A0ABP0KLE1_9DINO